MHRAGEIDELGREVEALREGLTAILDDRGQRRAGAIGDRQKPGGNTKPALAPGLAQLETTCSFIGNFRPENRLG